MADAIRRPNAVRRPSATSSLCFSSSRNDGNNSSSSAEPRYYALDAEMVTVVGPGELPARRAMVSIGVVNERLETLLYGRVAVPSDCEVIDGAFARMEGELCSSWEEGIPASCVSDFLERHVAAGGVLVGWEIHNDLAVAGFEKAAHQVRSGARERLPVERALADGGGSPGKTSHAGGAGGSGCARSLPPAAVEGRTGGVAPVAGSNGGGDGGGDGGGGGGGGGGGCGGGDGGGKRGGSGDGIHERSIPPPESPSKLEQEDIAPAGGGHGRGEDARPTSNGDDRPVGKGTAPENDGLRTEDTDRGGVSGEERDGQDAAAAAAGRAREREAPGEDGEARAARTGGGGSMRVVEVTDLFRTTKGVKCTLAEAYACCFDRVEKGSHNAAVDARMTMELHNLWRRSGQPEQPFGLPLSFFVVNFHSFKPSSSRHATLWGVLRPDGIARGSGGVIEKDSGSNTFKLSFRNNRDREAYFVGLERKMSSAGLKWQGGRQFVPGKKGAGDGYQLSCGRFKMHVLEHER